MDLKDMILVMENYKGTERNMLMTLEDYKKFVAIDDMSELADQMLLLGRTLAEGFTEYYRAANVTVFAKFCRDDVELGRFLNCCFVILLSLEAGSEKSLLMCASIVISIVLTDYFMLYMMERFNYLVQKQYEDAMYREEMHYKDIYYEEAEKQNKEVQKLKHDMKHKLHELYHLLENSDGHELSEKIGAMCIEFEQIDEKQYSDNPIVDSVLRIKFGRAKARGIKVETSIRIPKQMQLDHGDIGVLYGNLVDNAVEACSKVPEGQRFVKIENKYQSGILLLVITNSKTGKKNKSLKTTKKDNIRHGHGVQSVRKVVEKYNGTVSFTDKGDIFEVSAMLYGIEVKE